MLEVKEPVVAEPIPDRLPAEVAPPPGSWWRVVRWLESDEDTWIQGRTSRQDKDVTRYCAVGYAIWEAHAPVPNNLMGDIIEQNDRHGRRAVADYIRAAIGRGMLR